MKQNPVKIALNKYFPDVLTEMVFEYSGKLPSFHLHKSNLSKTILEKILFYECNICRANFRGAVINKCEFDFCKMGGSCFDFANVTNTIFTDTNLSMVNAKSANFKRCVFKYCCFDRSNLKNSIFTNCSFVACKFGNHMRGVSSNLTSVKFTGEKINSQNQARITCCDLSKSIMNNVIIEGILITGTSFKESQMKGVKWYNTIIRSSNLHRVNLMDSIFSNVQCEGTTTFNEADFTNANLKGLLGSFTYKSVILSRAVNVGLISLGQDIKNVNSLDSKRQCEETLNLKQLKRFCTDNKITPVNNTTTNESTENTYTYEMCNIQ